MNDDRLIAGNAANSDGIWATAISNRGEISGFGVTAKGETHAFLATPAQ